MKQGRAAVTVERLIHEHVLPPDYVDVVDRSWRPLAAQLAAIQRSAGRPIIVGVNGAQGSGKSTVCDFLARSLLPLLGCNAATLSLDDLYKTKSERQALARDVHPLFITRGVPGTHDIALGRSILARAASVEPGELALPRFDKARDDRMPPDQWPAIELPLDILLFEGWCVGARPQLDSALRAPVNALEADEDSDMVWRRHVNEVLGSTYQTLFAQIDFLIMLRPGSFEEVVRNRTRQERKMRSTANAKVMDDKALGRFMHHYERLTRHMFVEMPKRADLVFDLDERQVPFAR